MRKILIIDDAKVNRTLLTKILSGEYEILEAENGKNAMQLMEHCCKNISAVVLDLMMPEMDGYEVLRAMRDNAELSRIPVIVVTGSSDEQSRVKAISLGANDFVTKPFNTEIIKHCLKNAISLRESATIVNALQRDKLTGVFSREAFLEKVGAVSEKKPDSYVLECFDIDNFKLINDSFGAVEGDRILRHIGRELQKAFDHVGGICGRISGDNFAGLYQNTAEFDEYISHCRENSFLPDDIRTNVIFSVGRYVISDISLSPSAMYDRAYIAKQSVKGKYDKHLAYFSDSMLDKLIDEQQITGEMDDALEKGQFEVWFQPQVNHGAGSLIGAEALVRWRHPKKGLISPGVFIPLFEQNGFIYELDKFVWEKALQIISGWIEEGRSPIPVSVNISRSDLFREDLIETINNLIRRYEVPIGLLRLEITESAFADSTEQIISVVKNLTAAGFTIEIDDFGSGYSSLNTLKNVPADVIKLDMRFLEDSDDSERGGNILESVVRMAKWLGMSVLAEGVEEVEQADFLKSIGCNYIQGYLYAKPMPVREFEAFAEKIGRQEKMLTLETVENLDNNSFWNPKSMDTLIFNSYVGGACIFEFTNGKTELLRVNDRYAAEFRGKKMHRRSLSSMDPCNLLDEKQYSALVSCIEKAIKEKKESTVEVLITDLDGAEREMYITSTLRVIARTGERYLLYCVINNTTKQRHAEQKERETSDRLKKIMANINGGVTVTRIAGYETEIIYSNEQYYHQLGYTKKQFEEEVASPFDLVCEEDREKVIKETNAASSMTKNFSITYRVRHRDGTIRHLVSKISMIRLPGINVPVQLSVANDITELLDAEEKLVKTNEMLRLVADNIPGGIATYTYNTASRKINITYFNDGFANLLGYSRDEYELISKTSLSSRIFKEDYHIIEEQLEATLSTDSQMFCTYRVHTKDGGLRWLNHRGRVSDRTDSIIKIDTVLLDVTDEQQTIERLRMSEEKYRLAMLHSGSYICRYNVAEKTITMEPEMASMFISPEVLHNVPEAPAASGNVSEDTAEEYISFFKAIDRGEKSGTATFSGITKNGWRWMQGNFSTVFDSSGAPVSAVISIRDVTEQMEKESVYRKWQQSLDMRSEDSYTLFRCNLSRDVSYDSKEGTLLDVEFNANRLTFNELTLHYAKQFVTEEDRERYTQLLTSDRLLAGYYRGKRSEIIEYREKTGDGSLRWLRLTVDLVEYPNSKEVQAYLMYEDINEEKEEELLAIKLAQTDPLTGVFNRSAFTAKMDDAMNASGENAVHALMMLDIDGFKLVNDAFGHTTGDKLLIETAAKIRSALRKDDIVGRLGGDEFIIFLTNISGDGETAEIAQQICELTRDALSAEVQISSSIGIAMLPRDGMSFKTLYKKADLALYRIKGSGKDNFLFYSDSYENENLEPEKKDAGLPRLSPGMLKKRMLIVDDNRIDYEMLANIFKDEFVIDRAADGEAALIRLRHYGQAISVVLLDLVMPGTDGFEVLKKMRESSEMQMIPVIVVSGDDTRDASLRAIRCGASDFVIKPVDADVLRIRVFSAISKAENERLRAQNSYLKLHNDEVERYKTVLDSEGIAVIQYDWIKGGFVYSPGVSKHIAGLYDSRSLWRILLSDMVTDTATVRRLQEAVQALAQDKNSDEISIEIMLKTPEGKMHLFSVNAYKKTNEFSLTDRIFMAFKDLGSNG